MGFCFGSISKLTTCAIVVLFLLSSFGFTSTDAFDALDSNGNITIKWDLISWTPERVVYVSSAEMIHTNNIITTLVMLVTIWTALILSLGLHTSSDNCLIIALLILSVCSRPTSSRSRRALRPSPATSPLLPVVTDQCRPCRLCNAASFYPAVLPISEDIEVTVGNCYA